jgi:TRAP transporter 4TM/12TM fusion protein
LSSDTPAGSGPYDSAAVPAQAPDARHRTLHDGLGQVLMVVGALGALFHIYVLMVQPIQPWVLRAVHLSLTASLTFLLIAATARGRERGPGLADYALVLLAWATAFYIMIDFDAVLYRVGVTPNIYDVVLASITFLLIIEMGRRLQGMVLPVLALICVAYAIFGDLLPGLWGHRGYSYERTITYLYSVDGIYSHALAASATFIMFFIIFGTVLQRSGAGRLFMDTALALAGHTKGGPAKVAVVASALLGTVSGSSVSNVVTTGAFTIPMMKRMGYRPAFAGAVEAVASTGGQLMPPVMGVTAFVMAGVTGIPYLTIAAAAMIPAILYFVSVFFMISVEANNLGMAGLPRDSLPRLATVIRRDGHLLLPIVVLLYFLLIEQVSPMKSAFYGILAAMVASWFKADTRMGLKATTQAFYRALVSAMDVAAPCALAGVVVGVLSLTGLGLKFSDLLLGYVGDSKLLALIAVMVVSMVLGMGVPTVAAYLIAAASAAPVLVKLGVPVLSGHLFIFYFAALATITPPVAVSAFAAAGLAGSTAMTVGFLAMRLGIAAYIVPYMFVYGPSLLLDGPWWWIGWTTATACLGVYALSHCVLNRHKPPWRRVVLGAAALLLIRPGWVTDSVGLAVFALGAWREISALIFKRNHSAGKIGNEATELERRDS